MAFEGDALLALERAERVGLRLASEGIVSIP
jgi:hypothetical protein